MYVLRIIYQQRNNPNLVEKRAAHVVRNLDLRLLFPQLDSHCLEQNPAVEDMHKPKLILHLAKRFLRIRTLTHIKRHNEKLSKGETSRRNQRSKISHFTNE